ncbi:MAG: hypothetical protein ACK55I_37015, partial [bacterium]
LLPARLYIIGVAIAQRRDDPLLRPVERQLHHLQQRLLRRRIEEGLVHDPFEIADAQHGTVLHVGMVTWPCMRRRAVRNTTALSANQPSVLLRRTSAPTATVPE